MPAGKAKTAMIIVEVRIARSRHLPRGRMAVLLCKDSITLVDS